jgi:hypothetical protein
MLSSYSKIIIVSIIGMVLIGLTGCQSSMTLSCPYGKQLVVNGTDDGTTLDIKATCVAK